MEKIIMEQALEAYNVIREYCNGQYSGCGNCIFVDENECVCGFSSFNDCLPCWWSVLDLD